MNKEDYWLYNAVLFGIVGTIIMFWFYPLVLIEYFYFMGMCIGSIVIYLIEKERKKELIFGLHSFKNYPHLIQHWH